MSLQGLLQGLPDAGERLAQSNCSGLKLVQKAADHGNFTAVNFKDATLDQCRLRYGYFERCYFRKTVLRNVLFTGSRFKDCNFSGAEFDECCDFSYAEFENCQITLGQVERCLPTRENVRHELARNLRTNAQGRGNSDDYRGFLDIELKASETHTFKIFIEYHDPYYINKYRWNHRVRAFLDWCGMKVARYMWGYGESPWAVFRFAMAVVLFFAVAFSQVSFTGMPSDGWFEPLMFSFAIFTTIGYGAAMPASAIGRTLMVLEASLGLIFFGLLIAVLYNRFSRR